MSRTILISPRKAGREEVRLQYPHPRIAMAIIDLPTRGRYEVRGCAKRERAKLIILPSPWGRAQLMYLPLRKRGRK
jgi:hypothetical protein